MSTYDFSMPPTAQSLLQELEMGLTSDIPGTNTTLYTP